MFHKPIRLWCCACCLMLGQFVDSTAVADDYSFAQALRDCEITRKARETMLKDSELAGFNLGVMVRGNVATMWGTVQSVAQIEKAEAILRRIDEIRQVQVEIRIDPDEEPVPTTTLGKGIRSLNTDEKEMVGNDGGKIRPKIKTRNGSHPMGKLASGSKQPLKTNHSTIRRKENGQIIPVMPAISLPGYPGQQDADSSVEKKLVHKGEPANLDHAIRQIQRRELRFQVIQVRNHDGVIFVRKPANQTSDAQELAQLLAGLAGVKKVVLVADKAK